MTIAQPTLRTYFIVYILLMVGLLATVGIAYLPHGLWSLPGALAIAFGKAALVVLIFMHVYYSPRLTWIAVVSGLIWLAILLALTMADYVSRDWQPRGANPNFAAPSAPGELAAPPRTATAGGEQGGH